MSFDSGQKFAVRSCFCQAFQSGKRRTGLSVKGILGLIIALRTNNMATEVRNGVKDCMNGLEKERFSLSKALGSAKRLLIHGGNIANWNRTKRKTTPNPSDEVRVCRFCCVMVLRFFLKPLRSF